MTRLTRTRPVLEFEVVGVAVSVALVSGALAIVTSYLAPLTFALGALAFAGWAAGRSAGDPSPPGSLRRPDWAALGTLGLGSGVALWAPPSLLPFRGLILAVSLVPLWLCAGTRPRGAA